MALTWSQALAWRMQRQLLDPVGNSSVGDVVRRLVAVPAHPDAAAELAIHARGHSSRPGDVGRAIAAGRVIKVYLRIQSWITGLGDRLATVAIEGETALVMNDDLEELNRTPATPAVRLLPAYDQWILGPGTADAHVVPPHRRALLGRMANLVIAGGVVSGTWSMRKGQVVTDWFTEAGPAPVDELSREVARLATMLDQQLDVTVRSA